MAKKIEFQDELYFMDVRRVNIYYTPNEFKRALSNEIYSEDLEVVLIDLLNRFIEIEKYEYCVGIREFFKKHNIRLNYYE